MTPFAHCRYVSCPFTRRWTLATSLKYCMAGNAPVEALSPHMETFLKMMHNEDLDVKKAALLMVNAAVHHQVPYISTDNFMQRGGGGAGV